MNERELIEGYRFKIEEDPTDPRFEIITMRRPSNQTLGGPATPRTELTGNRARLRWIRMTLGHAAGVLGGVLSPATIKQIRRAVESFKDPN